eukprot:3261883-Prymnesium_polylepis.1
MKVGAAQLKVCQSALYHEYCDACEATGEEALSETTFRSIASDMANGRQTKQGALDPVGEQVGGRPCSGPPPMLWPAPCSGPCELAFHGCLCSRA